MYADCASCVIGYALRGLTRPMHRYIVSRAGTDIHTVLLTC